jgi:hypothetical protein
MAFSPSPRMKVGKWNVFLLELSRCVINKTPNKVWPAVRVDLDKLHWRFNKEKLTS